MAAMQPISHVPMLSRHLRGICFCIVTLAFFLIPATARAATYTICLRLPVTIDDPTGQSNEIGGTGAWVARGIRVETATLGGTPLSGFPKHADPDTGCFTFTATISQATTLEVGVKSWGIVGSGNELRAHTSGGVTSYYVDSLTLTSTQTSYIHEWWNEFHLLRTYAIAAYAINSGFQGNYDNELLRIWWYPNGTTDDDTACPNLGVGSSRIVNGVGYICLDENMSRRKFLIGHEYGHVNLYLAIASSAQTNDCSRNGAGHNFHAGKAEWNSCAAMEGWANFVATDLWNDGIHSGGSPEGYLRRWSQGNPLVRADIAHGDCSASSSDTSVQFRRQYGDVCFSDSNTWDNDALCSTGNCNDVGSEVDWWRTWWDYHTDTQFGVYVGHSQLHIDIKEAIPWGSSDFWWSLHNAVASLSLTRHQKLMDVADWEGASEP